MSSTGSLRITPALHATGVPDRGGAGSIEGVIERRPTATVDVGGVLIGSGHPIVVQSMTNTDTADADATAIQVAQLAHAGSELVRVTVNNDEAAKAVPVIREKLDRLGVGVPLIGDFHYNGHLLLTKYPAAAAALAKYRINPGNVGAKRRDANFIQIVEVAIANGKPVRIGVNWGSLDQQLLTDLMNANAALPEPRDSREVMIEAMVESAMRSARLAEETGLGHDRIILSAKVSGVQDLVEVYARLAERGDYPLHLGLTEAGMGSRGIISSTAGLSILLQRGIGDTIRVSLTPAPGGDRTEEVQVAQQVLQSMGLRSFTAPGQRLPRLRTHDLHLLPGDGPRHRRLPARPDARSGARHIRAWRSSRWRSWAAWSTVRASRSTPTSASACRAPSRSRWRRSSWTAQLRTTLRGDDIVPRFLEILDGYVAQRYPAAHAGGGLGSAPRHGARRRTTRQRVAQRQMPEAAGGLINAPGWISSVSLDRTVLVHPQAADQVLVDQVADPAGWSRWRPRLDRDGPRARVGGDIEGEERGLAGLKRLRLTRHLVGGERHGDRFGGLVGGCQAQLVGSIAASTSTSAAGGKQDEGARKGHAGKGMASSPRRRDWACRRHRSSLSILG